MISAPGVVSENRMSDTTRPPHHRENISSDSPEYDEIRHKDKETLRILFININGLPKDSQHPRNKIIYQSIQETQSDIIGMTETNLAWQQLSQPHQWRERTQSWWEASFSSLANNIHERGTNNAFQPGGVLTCSNGKVSHRAPSRGKDPTGLGRWSWIRFNGKNNIKLRVITVYRPPIPTSAGPQTIYSQHQRYFDKNERDICPRKATLDDLFAELTQWREEGDQLVVMIDLNEDVRSESIRDLFDTVGMREVITTTREHNNINTHQRGTVPIDGIFCSATLFPRRSGYLPFSSFPSDHRAIWIDLSYDNAFGFKVKQVPIPKARRMKTNIPKVRDKFIHDYKKFLREHKLHEKIYQLQDDIHMHPDEKLNKLNRILEKRLEGLLYADKHCRKLSMGNVPYSDVYSTAVKKIELWKGVLKKKSGGVFSSSKIRDMAKQLNIQNPLNCTKEEAIRQVRISFRHYWTVKKQADQHRNTFLDDLANQLSLEKKEDKATILKQLKEREKQRNTSRRIKYTLKKLQGSGVSKIQIQDDNGQWQDVTDKEGIEKACQEENERKYRQTENTICMQPPFINYLGYDGNTPEAEEIMNGTFTFPEGTHQYTIDYFNELKREQNIPHPCPPPQMTTDDFIDGWKKMKEQTSSGISGMHFGHMKACIRDQELADFEATVCHIPYNTGLIPELWKQGLCVMLFKKSGSDKINNLRTIVLQECDYNFNNKKLGREAMYHAERNKFIPAEQYGSRKGKRAIYHALNKRLTYDIIRMQRLPAAMCSNDAKSCYDRILHSIVMLSFRRMGFPEPPVDCMLKCIQQMKMYIRTMYGDSATFFSSANAMIPLQGILQGNGAGPTIWVIVSAPLINALRTANMGAHLLSAISKEPAQIVGFAFVDDTDLVTFHQSDIRITADEIMDAMQESIDRWEYGLKATGGAIVPNKSWVYPIDFHFNPDGTWRYKTVDEIDAEFSVRDHDDVRQPLRQFEADQGETTLGVNLAPDGNDKEAIRSLRNKTVMWRDLIMTGHLSPFEVQDATHTRIMKSLEYGLLALTLTEKECNYIMAPLLQASLNKSHISRTFPRDVVYGPIEMKGLGYKNLYTTKGAQQIATLTQFLGTYDDITSQLLKANIEAAHIELGTGANIFDLDYDTFSPILTDTWIKQVWKFTRENNIFINDQMSGTIPLLRQGDSFIMHDIIALSRYKKKDLQRINACRLYLQVLRKSDIITGDGLSFTHEAYNCIQHLQHQTYIWPKQNKPNTRSIRLWKQALRLAYPRNDSRHLIHPLGRWRHQPSRSTHKWFYHPESQLVYQRFGATWKTYRRQSRAGRIGANPLLVYNNPAFSLPVNACRATIERKQNRYRLTGWCQEQDNLYSLPDWDENKHRLIQSSRNSMQEDELFVNTDSLTLSQAISNSTLKIVSDGSYLETENIGTAAWLLAVDRHSYKLGRHVVSGKDGDQNSYRSELSGILGSIYSVIDICEEHGITTGTVTIYCDGESAIKTMKKLPTIITPETKQFDILRAIRRAMNISKITWQFHHVRGHQDLHTELDDLDDVSYLNTIADTEAKDKLSQTLRRNQWKQHRPLYFHDDECTIKIYDNQFTPTYMSSNVASSIYKYIHTQRIQQYWQNNRDHYNERTKTLIDWKSLGKALTSWNPSQRRWLSKWSAEQCGVGTCLKRWKQQSHANCPRCSHLEEDTLHVILCKDQSATECWNTQMKGLEEWILSNKGDPDIATLFVGSIRSWRQGTLFPTIPPSYNKTLHSALTQQDFIGWESVFHGYLSKKWAKVQSRYFESIGSKRSAILWVSKFQRKIWEVAWKMWEHRNLVLHEERYSIHDIEKVAINATVIREWNTGVEHLPPRYNNLFSGTMRNKLTLPPRQQLLWLISVLYARQRVYGSMDLPVLSYPPLIMSLISRHQRISLSSGDTPS